MKESKAFWDKSAPKYAKSVIRDEASYQKKLSISQGYFQPDWDLLEFGCGTGSTAIIHAPYVKHILATDISGEMLAIAKAKARNLGIENISFQQGTLGSLELETKTYDAVLGLNILHLLEDVDSAISDVYDLLKAGGIFISSTVLLNQMNMLWRLLIPPMQRLNLAPFVNPMDKQALLTKLTDVGFNIDQEWQPGKESIFIVARKRG